MTTNETETSTETNASSNSPPLGGTEERLLELLERREQGTATSEDEDEICSAAIDLFIDRLFGTNGPHVRANLLVLPDAVKVLNPLFGDRLTREELEALRTILIGMQNLDACLHAIFRAIAESWTADQQRDLLSSVAATKEA